MAVDTLHTLHMDGNHYAPHFGALQAGSGYGAYSSYDTYGRQTQVQPLHRGPPQPHMRQSHGYFMHHHGRPHNAPHKNSVQGKRKFDYPQAPQQPLLQQLRQENLKKARRHFQGSFDALSTPGSTPRTAPRAPDNRHGFLLSAPGSVLPATGTGLHAVTPSAVPGGEQELWKNSYGNADKEAVQLAAAAGLDFLGSFYDSACGGDEDEFEDRVEVEPTPQEPEQQPPATFDEEASFPPQAKRKLASQAAYIAQLEEQQLTLRERIFLLEQQLSEARRQQGGSLSGHSGDLDDGSDDGTSQSD